MRPDSRDLSKRRTESFYASLAYNIHLVSLSCGYDARIIKLRETLKFLLLERGMLILITVEIGIRCILLKNAVQRWLRFIVRFMVEAEHCGHRRVLLQIEQHGSAEKRN